MKISRRKFLEESAVRIGGVMMLGTGFASVAAKPSNYDPYEPVELGQTGLRYSRLCMGTGVRGGNRQSNHTRMGKAKCEALMREAYDRGIRWFDLADLYGTHPFVIPALQNIPRDKFGVITKVWFRPGGLPEKDRPDATVVVERFLKELKTDYIDLLLFHCVVSPKWPEELRRQMDLVSKLKDRGLVRAHGVSCHSIEALEAAAAEPWVQSVHARINPYGVKMDGPVEKVVPVLKKLKAAGKGVVAMKIMGEGDFRHSEEKRENSVKFVLELGCVDLLNVGFEQIAEVDDFAQRVKRVPRAT